MSITREETCTRVTKYIVERLLPNVSSQVGKFKLGFCLPLVPQMVGQYWEMGIGLGIVDGTHLDTERLSQCLLSGIGKSDGLTIQGFRFSAEDAKAFIEVLNG